MTLDVDLAALHEYNLVDGNSCCPPQDIAANYRKAIASLSKKKATEAKVYFRYVTDAKGELILDCTFKVKGMFFGFFTVHRCKDQEKWSPDGRYYVTSMFGCGGNDYDGGAITGLAQAKALAVLNTRVLMAAMQNVTLK